MSVPEAGGCPIQGSVAGALPPRGFTFGTDKPRGDGRGKAWDRQFVAPERGGTPITALAARRARQKVSDEAQTKEPQRWVEGVCWGSLSKGLSFPRTRSR